MYFLFLFFRHVFIVLTCNFAIYRVPIIVLAAAKIDDHLFIYLFAC